MEFQEDRWHDGFRKLNFAFEDRKAILVLPEEQAGNRHWLLKTEYFDAFPGLEMAMLHAGYALAWLQNRNRWGIDEDMEAKLRFRNFLMEQFHFSARCIPVGMSCGGLHAIKLAAAHPEMVSALYLDAPVVNLLSCPFGLGQPNDMPAAARQEALDALGLTMPEMLAYRDHPLDRLPRLIAARIPAVLVCGDSDRTVHFEENGLHVKRMYEASGVPFLFQMKPGCAYHPHGPADMQAVIRFLEKYDQ